MCNDGIFHFLPDPKQQKTIQQKTTPEPNTSRHCNISVLEGHVLYLQNTLPQGQPPFSIVSTDQGWMGFTMTQMRMPRTSKY